MYNNNNIDNMLVVLVALDHRPPKLNYTRTGYIIIIILIFSPQAYELLECISSSAAAVNFTVKIHITYVTIYIHI